LSTGVTTGSQKHLHLTVKEHNPMAQANKTHNNLVKSGLNNTIEIKRSSINSSGITNVPQNSATTNKMRKAPSDFQLG
jgi:hypothetical protein